MTLIHFDVFLAGERLLVVEVGGVDAAVKRWTQITNYPETPSAKAEKSIEEKFVSRDKWTELKALLMNDKLLFWLLWLIEKLRYYWTL